MIYACRATPWGESISKEEQRQRERGGADKQYRKERVGNETEDGTYRWIHREEDTSERGLKRA